MSVIENHYALGYRDDKPNGRFHDIINLGKVRTYANAIELYKANNPDLAE